MRLSGRTYTYGVFGFPKREIPKRHHGPIGGLTAWGLMLIFDKLYIIFNHQTLGMSIENTTKFHFLITSHKTSKIRKEIFLHFEVKKGLTIAFFRGKMMLCKQRLRRRRYGTSGFQRVGGWCEPIAKKSCYPSLPSLKSEFTVGFYVSRVKGRTCLSLKWRFFP